MSYPTVKNEANRDLALANSKKYGFFKLKDCLGIYSIISIEPIEHLIDSYRVLFMNESEFNCEFLNCVVGNQLKVEDGVLKYLVNGEEIMSNHTKFIEALVDLGGAKLDIEKSIKSLENPEKIVTNAELKQLREIISDAQTALFNVLGPKEAFQHRIKLNEVSNDLYFQMKRNKDNGDDTVPYL